MTETTNAPAVAGVEAWVCAACAHGNLLPTSACHYCGGPLEHVSVPGRGTVWSQTAVRLPSEHHADGYGLVYVDLPYSLRVLCERGLDTPEVRIGQEVAFSRVDERRYALISEENND